MLFQKKKSDDDKTEFSPIVAAQNVRRTADDYIPYYCHWDPHTLLTKNGELMQIIKIASNTRGLDYESGDSSTDATVREMLRKAIAESIGSEKISFWVHTIRKRKNIRYGAQFKEAFAGYTHERWQNRNRWKYQYYNEIYVSVLFDAQSADLLHKKHMKHVYLTRRNRHFRNAYLEKTYTILDRTVTTMLEKIRLHYNAQRLTIVERIPTEGDVAKLGQAIFYSEPLEFLATLVNLRVEPVPLPEVDLSSVLCSHMPTFGFNALETRNAAGKRRFGALLSLKQYREITTETADRILQAPLEFIITQTYNFTPAPLALRGYRAQKEYYDISGDEYSIKATGIDEMLRANKKKTTDFGEQQTTIMVLADDYKQLDPEVIHIQNAFSELGFITIREDIKLEDGYWAQLPGNFEFIRRKDIINTAKASGFSRLNRFPNGTSSNNHWGDAITLMSTSVNSPYFFNFHHQDNGHTVVFDYNSFHDAAGNVLLNFLITESRKYNGRFYLFDRNQSARLFFDKLGGTYHLLAPPPNIYAPPNPNEHPKLRLNPFTLDESPRNMGFLLAWVSSLLAPDMNLPDGPKETLRTAIGQLYTRPPEQRNFDALMEEIQTLDPKLVEAFGDWRERNKNSGLINLPQDTLDLSSSTHAFDMTTIVKRPETIIPVFSYLMHRIITSLDGRPTMIVLHEAWDLLENPFFAPRLESLLEMLKQNNVMVIFTTGKPFDQIDTHCFKVIMQHCATCLYIPDDVALNYVSAPMGLNAVDARMLLRMERQKGEFLLRQNGESIALKVDMVELDDLRAIYANDIKNMVAAGGKFSGLPQFND